MRTSQTVSEILYEVGPPKRVSQSVLEVLLRPSAPPASAVETTPVCVLPGAEDVCIRLEVAWDGVNWTDESAHFLSARGKFGFSGREVRWLGLGLGNVGRATVELRNAHSRYSPDNPSASLYAYTASGGARNKPIRISACITGNSAVLFTGYIRDLRERAAENRVILECEDLAALLSDLKLSSSLYCDITTGCYVETILQLAGLAASQYRVEKGYVMLPFAWMDDEPVWQELGLVAEVEGGRVYIDSEGVLNFQDAAHTYFLSGSYPVLTCSHFADLQPEYDWRSHYNVINVEYFGRDIGPHRVIYETPAAVVVHPGETQRIVARLDTPAVYVDIPQPNVDYYALSRGGMDISSQVTLSTSVYAQRVVLEWTNNSDFTAFISGIQLTGLPVTGIFAGVASASSASSVAKWGKLVWEFPENPYLQDVISAQYIADFLRDRLSTPQRIWTLRDLPGSLDFLPGKRVAVREERTGASVVGIITDAEWKLGPGFSVDLRVAAPNLFTCSDYFKIDESEWGGSRLWY